MHALQMKTRRQAAEAPAWLGAIRYWSMLFLFVALGAVNTWAASVAEQPGFGLGRAAVVSSGETLGRAILSFSGVVAWLCAGVLLLSGLKLLARRC